MKHARLLSTVAAAVLLTAGAASAQSMKNDAAPAPAPAAQQNAPAEKVAPNMKAGQPNAQKAPETTAQAPMTGAKPANPDKASDKGAMDNKAAQSAPLKPSDANSSTTVKPSAAQNTPAAAPNAAPSATQSTTTTTGQGAAAGAAKLSVEQRTKITTVLKSQKVERIEPSRLNISISVGTRVPNTVKYYPLPQEVIVIYPEWRGYDYILVGDQIVILDPRTHEIVMILEA